MSSSILIVGASVRAAAESAAAAGYDVKAIDLFNDDDLSKVADCRHSTLYPEDLPRLASQFPNMPYLYTGALENFPDILEELSADHSLVGNGPSVLEKIRDPFWLADLLNSESLPTLRLKDHNTPPDDLDNWLIKPFRSGHGMRIRSALETVAQDDEYYQELKQGLTVGVVFLADGTQCQLLGCHQQVTGLHSDPIQSYQFCGALAPFTLPDDIVNVIADIGKLLTREASLCGLFGCDFIVSDATPYLLEVNPRYTAAMELWETLLHRSLIADHITACQSHLLPPDLYRINSTACLKLILYAPERTVVSPNLSHCLDHVKGARLADLPTPGTRIALHEPVCTLLISGHDFSYFSDALNRSLTAIASNCGWDFQVATDLSGKISSRIAGNIA